MASEQRRLQPRREPRQVRAELTRQRILTAAAHIFAEHGYAAGTTNRIAERARISIGSLYQYFPNKDAILAELLTRHLDAGADAYSRLPGAHEQEPIGDILRRRVRTSIANHQDDPRLLRLMVEEAPRASELMRQVEDHHRMQVAHLRDLLTHHPEVSVADTDTAAKMIVSTVEIVVHQLVAADQIDGRRLEDEMVAMLTRYLTAAAGE